jgi:hypothetical protein
MSQRSPLQADRARAGGVLLARRGECRSRRVVARFRLVAAVLVGYREQVAAVLVGFREQVAVAVVASLVREGAVRGGSRGAAAVASVDHREWRQRYRRRSRGGRRFGARR